jgi:alcohol dehydrogenase class IV
MCRSESGSVFRAAKYCKLDESFIPTESKKIFLVTGKHSFELSGAKEILSEQLKSYSIVNFNDFTANPKIDNIKEGIELFNDNDCDVVIAVGGGSVIDMAKSINILSVQNGDPKNIIQGREKILNKGKNLIAIPTTSGAGSEATHFAVVYIDKEKFSIAHEYILPNTAIVDPTFTFKLNSRVTAISGIDALSQAMESHWSVNSDNESKNIHASR